MPQTIDLRRKQELSPEPEKRTESAISSVQETVKSDTISWSATLSRTIPKRAAWRLAFTLFAAAAALIYFGPDVLFGIAVGLAGMVILLRSHKPPVSSQIDIDRSGITVDGQRYFYHQIGSFWLNYEPPYTKELSVHFRKIRAPLRVPLQDANPLEIRSIMVQFIPEKEHERSLLDEVIDRIGY